jgi:hypothetical protein
VSAAATGATRSRTDLACARQPTGMTLGCSSSPGRHFSVFYELYYKEYGVRARLTCTKCRAAALRVLIRCNADSRCDLEEGGFRRKLKGLEQPCGNIVVEHRAEILGLMR